MRQSRICPYTFKLLGFLNVCIYACMHNAFIQDLDVLEHRHSFSSNRLEQSYSEHCNPLIPSVKMGTCLFVCLFVCFFFAATCLHNVPAVPMAPELVRVSCWSPTFTLSPGWYQVLLLLYSGSSNGFGPFPAWKVTLSLLASVYIPEGRLNDLAALYQLLQARERERKRERERERERGERERERERERTGKEEKRHKTKRSHFFNIINKLAYCVHIAGRTDR